MNNEGDREEFLECSAAILSPSEYELITECNAGHIPTQEGFLDYVKMASAMCEVWECVFKVDDNIMTTSLRLNLIFKFNASAQSSQTIIADMFNRLQSIRQSLYNMLTMSKSMFSIRNERMENVLQALQDRFQVVYKTLEIHDNLINYHTKLKNVTFDHQSEDTGTAYDAIIKLSNGESFSSDGDQPDRKITDYYRLYAKFVKWLKDRNLRKIADKVYRPAFNQKGENVYAFEEHPDFRDIESLVGHIPIIFKDWDTFYSLLGNGAISRMNLHLKTIETPFFPTLKKDRYTLAFQNGLYSLRTLLFYPFSERKLPPHFDPSKFSAVKYHRIDYDYVNMNNEQNSGMYRGNLRYQNINMGPFYKVLKHQKYDEQEIFFIYAMLGRVLYEQNYRLDDDDMYGDNFESELWFEGVAQSGKSTMMKWIQEVVPIADVGVISNQVEKNFPLMGCVDRLFYLVYEMNENFNLDQMLLQNMISGEMINIAVKNKAPTVLKWNMHGCFSSNNIPDFKDNQNSMARRFCVVSHLVPVLTRDEKLFRQGIDNMDRFITVISRAYHHLLRESYTSDGGFRTLIPPKIMENTKRVMSQCNPIRAFIDNKCVRVIGEIEEKTMDPSYKTPMTDFIKCYKIYRAEQDLGDAKSGISRREINMTILSSGFLIFDDLALGKIIYGLRLK
jgi:hypothetical protein